MSESLGTDEESLLISWLTERRRLPYVEPLLDSDTVGLMKFACDRLRADAHVFVAAVDIATSYVHAMNAREAKIENQLVAVLSAIGIASKYSGALSDLTVKPLSKLYQAIAGESIPKLRFRRSELSILGCLKGFPVSFIIDDVKALGFMFEKSLNLSVDLIGLCVDILIDVYVRYKKLVKKLKSNFGRSERESETFVNLMSNRFYVPSGIVFVAFKMTKLKNVFDLDCLLKKLSEMTGILEDHIVFLSELILDYFYKNA